MRRVFYYCSASEILLPNIYGEVTDAGMCFEHCANLERIVANDWAANSPNIIDQLVFTDCSKLPQYPKNTGAFAKPISQGGNFTAGHYLKSGEAFNAKLSGLEIDSMRFVDLS